MAAAGKGGWTYVVMPDSSSCLRLANTMPLSAIYVANVVLGPEFGEAEELGAVQLPQLLRSPLPTQSNTYRNHSGAGDELALGLLGIGLLIFGELLLHVVGPVFAVSI
jgi:hypothetical protein